MAKGQSKKACPDCKRAVKELQEQCAHCGFSIVIEPSEQARARYLRGPSLGALCFTQGFTFGARLYFWFVLSLIPIVGIAALIIMVLFGRRLSWQAGGWGSWQEFRTRMKILDAIGIAWVAILIGAYLIARYA